MNSSGKRLGYISPGALETMVHDFFRCAPSGLRFSGLSSGIGGWAPEQFDMAVAKLIEGCTYLVEKAGADFIIAAGGPLMILRGNGADLKMMKQIREATGIEITVSARSVLSAFEHLGIRRIAMATPYPPYLQKKAIDFYTAGGLEIVKDAYLDLPMEKVLSGDFTPEQVYDWGGEILAGAPDAEGLFIAGGQLRALEAVEALERDYGRPVVVSNSADFWLAFRALGIRPKIEGNGTLLRSLS